KLRKPATLRRRKLTATEQLRPRNLRAQKPRFQNRLRTGVPKRAARLGWWMRAGRNFEQKQFRFAAPRSRSSRTWTRAWRFRPRLRKDVFRLNFSMKTAASSIVI